MCEFIFGVKDDIRNILVAISEVPPKSRGFLGTIRLEGSEPAVGLDRIQQQRDAMLCRDLEHIVDPLKIGGVRC